MDTETMTFAANPHEEDYPNVFAEFLMPGNRKQTWHPDATSARCHDEDEEPQPIEPNPKKRKTGVLNLRQSQAKITKRPSGALKDPTKSDATEFELSDPNLCFTKDRTKGRHHCIRLCARG